WRVLRVPREGAGQRAAVLVHSHLRNTSRTRARAIVEASAYSLAGRRLRPNDRVKAQDHIALWRAPVEEGDVEIELAIIHEDAALLAVDKPPLVTVHPT